MADPHDGRKAAVPANVLTMACPCGAQLSVKAEFAGKKVRCSKCQTILVAPAAIPAAQAPPPAQAHTLDGLSPEESLSDRGSQSPSSTWSFLAPARAADEIGRLGPYRVLQVLGAGGMGVVFKAEDPALKRLVALKAMLPSAAQSPGAKQRFLREARTAAALKHDHIVSIFQVGEDRDVPFLAMEFLKGESLDDRLKRDGRLSISEALRIGSEVADGLAAAHEEGLIHRDIKPANVWMEARAVRRKDGASSAGQSPARVKILDFGLARADGDAHLTQSGVIVGTPAYMPPEQARSEPVDARCDLYSLGVLLYKMVTGDVPFKGSNTLAVLTALAMDTPKEPMLVNPEVPRPLNDLIMRLLAKKAADRPASAQEVYSALKEIDAEPTAPLPKVEARAARPAAPKAVGSATDVTVAEGAVLTAQPSRRRRVPFLVAGVGALVVGFVVALGVMLLWPTPYGTVRIESDDPNVEVVFDKDGPTVKGASKEPIKLKSGPHGLVVKHGDFEVVTDQFAIKKGEVVTLKVELLKDKIQVLRDGTVIAARERPAAPARDPMPQETKPMPGKGGPTPTARWSFAKNAIVDRGQLAATLEGGAVIQRGRLILNGESAFLRTDPLDRPLAARTLEAWVTLANLDQRGGAIISIETADGNVFDALVYGEKQPRHWIAGSDEFARTRELGGDAETARPDELVHLAATYGDDGRIAVYRNGVLYGVAYTPVPKPITFPAQGARFLLGKRHSARNFTYSSCFAGEIVEARYYDRALSGEEIASSFKAGPDINPPMDPVKGSGSLPPEPGYVSKTTGMKFVRIKAGTFTMGSPKEEDGHKDDETQHEVKLTKNFDLGTYAVTRGEFRKFADETGFKDTGWLKPGFEQTDEHPVVNVSWEDAVAYAKWLSGKDGQTYRLPTEAEWEYACRGGTDTSYYFGNDEKDLPKYANFGGTLGGTSPVGKYKPNPFGLYDMHGNVWQWCSDAHGAYPTESVTDPTGSSEGSLRVLRGGCWLNPGTLCRAAIRRWFTPSHRVRDLGFRLARSLPVEPSYISKTTGMKFVRIKAGTFTMGSPKEEEGHRDDETQHEVKLTKDFDLGMYTVTRGEFRKFVDDTGYKTEAETANDPTWRDPGITQTDEHPVVRVSWNDAVKYAAWLSQKDGQTYRLPTEAEWEYSCRGGTGSKYHFGNDEKDLHKYANFGSGGTTCVGKYKPNAYGLYDMHGNVAHWCSDWRVLRGSSWARGEVDCRAARRYIDPNRISSSFRNNDVGFRLARSLPSEDKKPEPVGTVEPSFESKTTGMKFVHIKAGTFTMGSPKEESGRNNDDGRETQHEVKLTKDFDLGMYAVTRGQFRKFVDDTGYKTDAEAANATQTWLNPGITQTDDHPVVYVTWNDAVKYAMWLSEKDGQTYRLPTDAEWEYSCRSGSGSRYHFGNDEKDLPMYANFGRAVGGTSSVGKYKPNAYGLYDMHGNVCQWCSDWFGPSPPGSVTDPTGPPEPGSERVIRGSGWMNDPWICRAAHRYKDVPSTRSPNFGFRLARSLPPETSHVSKTTGMKFVHIKAGTFVMGSPKTEEGRYDHETQHEVKLTKDFDLGLYAVTRGQFRTFVEETGYQMPANSWLSPGFAQTDEHPVVNVSWDDAVAYAKWLSGKDGQTYRLPTEAEWEYACRGGTVTSYHFGNDEKDLSKYANFGGTLKGTTPVGKYKPNPFGLFDMHGNVGQWCSDLYGDYPVGSVTDPTGLLPGQGPYRVLRGGGWPSPAGGCRAARRRWSTPSDRYQDFGFRLARSSPSESNQVRIESGAPPSLAPVCSAPFNNQGSPLDILNPAIP